MIKLPLEIIQHIISISIPLPSFDNRDRADFLLPLCVVHRSIHRYAQRLLLSHPVLKSVESFDAFAEVLSKNPEWGGYIGSLRVGDTDEEKSSMMTVNLEGVLVHCTELRKLWLASMNRVYVRNLSLAPKLHSLYCDDVGLWLDSSDETPYCLPSLVKLGLISVDIYKETDEQPLFSPAILPALRKLSLEMVLFDTAEYNPRLESIAGQLEHVAFDLQSPTNLQTLLKRCDRLVAFSYGGGSQFSSESLGSRIPLRFLRLDYSLERTDSLARMSSDLSAAIGSGLIGTSTVVNLPWARESRVMVQAGIEARHCAALRMPLETDDKRRITTVAEADEQEGSFSEAFWEYSRDIDRRMLREKADRNSDEL